MIIKQQDRQWLFFLCFIGIILYWNSLHTPFLWDEDELIVNDPRVHNWSRIPEIFRTPFFKGSGGFSRYYRPLSTLSFALDYHLWKFNPLGYHITNLFFHLANTLLVYFLYKRFLKQATLAFLGAFLFLAHPAHVEAVTYIPGRVDLISLFFLLLSFHLYLIGRETAKKFWPYGLSVFFYGCALLSKEMAAFFPIIVFSHFFLQNHGKKFKGLKRKEGLFFLGLFGCFLLWALVRQWVSVHIPFRTLLDFPLLLLRLFVLPKILFAYTRIWFFPWPLYVEHVVSIAVLRLTTLIFEWVAFLFIIVTILLFFRKREERFWLVWIGVALLPVIQIFPIYMMAYHLFIAEHFLYFASIGIIGFLVTRYSPLLMFEEGRFLHPRAVCSLGAVLVLFSFLVIWRNGEYRDRTTFFEQTVRHAPWSFRAYNQLGLEYLSNRDFDRAEKAFQKESSLDPNDGISYINLGLLAYQRGDFEKSRNYYQKAHELNPKESIPLYGLGVLEGSEGKWRNAIRFFEKATEMSPDYLCAYSEMTHAYWELGEKEKAVQTVSRGLKRDPSSPLLLNIKRWIEKRIQERY